jgi:hypothetical protein
VFILEFTTKLSGPARNVHIFVKQSITTYRKKWKDNKDRLTGKGKRGIRNLQSEE